MKRNSLIILLLAALFMPLAMNAQGLTKAPRGTALQTVGVQNSTRQETPQNRDRDGWLQYDDGNYLGGTGQSTAYYWTYASMYPASMLGNNNTLSQVAFYENTSMYVDLGVTIDIYSGGNDAPENLIYSEDADLNGSAGMHVVELATPVTIDPTQNLWISITVAGTYVLAVCSSTESNNDWYLGYDSETEEDVWLHLGDQLAGYGWMIRGYVEYVNPDACPKPTGLTVDNITGHTATLSWNSASGSTWQICVDGNESNLITTSQNSYTLTGLTAETDYTVKVRTKCSNTDISNWSSELAFTTDVACPAPTITPGDITATSANITLTSSANSYNLRYRNAIFFDDFESEELTDWTIYTEGEVAEGLDGWRIIDPSNGLSWTGHNGSTYVASAWSWSSVAYHANNWLITPQVQLGGILHFYVYTNQGYPDDYEVLLSTSGNDIDDFTVTLKAMASVPTTGDWVEVNIDLNAYANQTGYIALHHEFYDGNYILIDDFGIFNRTWTTANGVTSPYPMSGLTPETTYEVQAQAVCGGQDGSSEWSNVFFTTLPTCLAPSNLTVYDITTTDAWLSWDGNASRYILKVNDQQYNNVTSPYHLTGLTAATSYIIEMQAVCTDASSDWATTTFLTEFCEEADKCEIFYELTDSYGDGWNGALLLVVDAETNTLIDYWTVPSNSSTYSGSLLVCNDRQLQFVWYSGNYDDECDWIITDVNGDMISTGNGDDYVNYEIIRTYTVDCTITSCRYPTDLTVTNFTPTSVTLTWTENGEATAWKVQYTAGGRPQTVDASDTEVTITSLTPGTSISAKVRPVCDVNNRWSEPITFTIPDVFVNSGRWDVGSNWYSGAVPAEGSDVGIQANVIVPADYSAIANNVSILDGGSITVADGGQLLHQTFGLEVTMQKNVAAFTGSQDNYELVTFPFIDDELEVPADMTLMANDFYLFDNSQAGEEWQNNKANTIDHVELYEGYLYANPTATTLSMTGQTFSTPEYSYGHSMGLYYDETENEVNGWYLLGNPYTSNAYIYGATETSLFAMDVMYYDANGNMQTIVGGPVPPMQGFFVKITEDTQVWFLAEEYDLSSKAPLHAVVDKKADKVTTAVEKNKTDKKTCIDINAISNAVIKRLSVK